MKVISIQAKPDGNHFDLKPCTLTDLARLYELSPKTMRKRIKALKNEIGIKRGRYYTTQQVEMIFIELMPPKGLELSFDSSTIKLAA